MNDTEKGQVTKNAAEVYEEFFLPALFDQWPRRIIEIAELKSGDRVLDVACGTGILARTAVSSVGEKGSVTGLDLNKGMLEVAKQKEPAVEWVQGRAEALPFGNDSFDAVVSQFGLMFFEDQPKALQEMIRVLKPGLKMVVAVWDALENSQGYLEMVNLLEQLFGGEIADALRVPFLLGDLNRLHSLFYAAGVKNTQIKTLEGTARFPSIESWVYTDIKGWTLADKLSDAQFDRLLSQAKIKLSHFVNIDGTVSFPAPAHVVTVSKTGNIL